jgi:hypothetical protein
MDSVTIRELCGNSAVEAMDLADVGAGCHAGMPDEIPGSGLRWSDVDAMAERASACPAGYVEAMCLGCGCGLYVPETERTGSILCPTCQRIGEHLAEIEDGGGDEPDPTPGYPAGLAKYAEADLIDAIAKVDEARFDDGRWVGIDVADPHDPDAADATKAGWILKTRSAKDEFLAAATAELLRRIDAPRRLAA